MSGTSEWLNRLAHHRYSQDERALGERFRKELEPRVNAFLDDPIVKVLVVGCYDLQREPWRLAACADFRKYGLKLLEREVGDQGGQGGQVELSLRKSRR